MSGKLPTDAFDAYVALGDQRTYAAVAERFNVDRKTVIRRAKAENWQGRLSSIQQAARRESDKKLVETIEQMNDRHLATLRVIQGKALQALRAMPISAAMDAIRALDISIRGERLIRGEPTDRNAVNIEEVIRREYDRWLVRPDGDGGSDDAPSSSSNGHARKAAGLSPLAIDDGGPSPTTHDDPDDEDDDELP